MPVLSYAAAAGYSEPNDRHARFVIPSNARNLSRFIIAFPTRFLTAFGMTNKLPSWFCHSQANTRHARFVIPSIFYPPRNLDTITSPQRSLTSFGMTNKHDCFLLFRV